ncbi:MAG TPA: EF-Tu/IF-2/RF-3 family GTPase [Candidatus Thermoplasmatota archaeon]|nr:EF-Tu/IF-2/RF-3 family GTPase [Candidatus Thermoplasmatota archaeon]
MKDQAAELWLVREKRLGMVRDYDPALHSAAVRIERGALHEGDRIRIVGHGHELVEPVRNLEMRGGEVLEARHGQTVGLLVDYPVEKEDEVFLLETRAPERRAAARPPSSWWSFP